MPSCSRSRLWRRSIRSVGRLLPGSRMSDAAKTGYTGQGQPTEQTEKLPTFHVVTPIVVLRVNEPVFVWKTTAHQNA